MKKMMQKMGMDMKELDAEEVVIKLRDGKITITKPTVSVVTAMNQKTYQITGEEAIERSFPEDDVKLVAAQAGATEDAAKKALEESGGDLAKAIMRLTSLR